MEIKTVKSENFTMKYISFGQGDETFVILPGLSTESVMKSADLVADQYDDMTEDFTIYLFDRRENLPEGLYTIKDMAEDTAEAMTELGLHDVSLFGASQGGMIAEMITICHPDLVKDLILGSTAAVAGEEEYKVIGHWVDLAVQRKREELYLDFGEKLYPKEVFDGLRDTFITMSEGVTDEELDHFIRLAVATKGFDASGEMSDIKCPVLVLGSEDDAVLGTGSSRLLADLLKDNKGLKVHMYNGFGHAAFDTAPDYRQRMTEFIKG